MINTFNETHLHRTLKKIYAADENARCEVKAGPYIADIFIPENRIIEIQTASVSHLLKKAEYFISEKYKVKIVYPMVSKKTIETRNPMTNEIKITRSPKKDNIYSIFKEFTGIYPVFLKRNFSMDIIDVNIIEERTVSEEPVQSRNKRRRFLKNWIKSGKRLDTINSTITLATRRDYLKLLPFSIREARDFTLTELQQAIFCEKETRTRTKDLKYFLWVYTKMGITELTGKKGKSNLYSVKTE